MPWMEMAEFLALGKAIISTPHYNKLPQNLIKITHLIYAERATEISEAIEKLTSDIEFKRKLELESIKYFNEYLVSQKVIKRLVEKA